MTSADDQKDDAQLWAELVSADNALLGKRYSFARRARDPVGTLRGALLSVSQRGAALRTLAAGSEENKQKLLDTLLETASVAHSDIVLCRDVILSITDRSWLVREVDPIVQPILARADAASDEEPYLRIAELYDRLDAGLLEMHLRRCQQHSDPNVQEILELFE